MYAELKQIVCEVCAETKPARYHKTTKVCAQCAEKARNKAKSVLNAKKRKENKEFFRAKDLKHDLKRRYGIPVEERDRMYKSQDGKCACCGAPEDKFQRKLHVDHDRDTGQVRALLCTKCNPGIGYFDHSVEKLEMAIAYIKKFKK